jgi:hypothetical protein
MITLRAEPFPGKEYYAKRAIFGQLRLYPGNPKRATIRPTTEMMLRIFTRLTLVLLHQGDSPTVHVTPLTPLQQRILALLDVPREIYTQLRGHFTEPILNLSEP